MPQRLSPRGPPPLRTSSSDSDPLHNRPITDRSPKIGDRRSPRGVLPELMGQKKLGTRIAGLESQLEQAQAELRSMKEQLASAEAAKKEAQKELEKNATKPIATEPVIVQDKRSGQNENQESSNKEGRSESEHEIPVDNQNETDVFEVPIEKMALEPKVEYIQQSDDQDELKPKPISITELIQVLESDKVPFDQMALKDDEITLLKAKIEEKEKELEVAGLENESLKSRLHDAALQMASAKAKEEEMTLKLSQVGEELGGSKSSVVQLNEKLKEVEGAKENLETEMKKLRVQTEQWRKAADAAASILAGGVDMNNGRRISERCGSMDKHYGNVFEPGVGGYAGYVGSPGLGDDSDDGFGAGKRKGSSIKMFGDLWKKKGQK